MRAWYLGLAPVGALQPQSYHAAGQRMLPLYPQDCVAECCPCSDSGRCLALSQFILTVGSFFMRAASRSRNNLPLKFCLVKSTFFPTRNTFLSSSVLPVFAPRALVRATGRCGDFIASTCQNVSSRLPVLEVLRRPQQSHRHDQTAQVLAVGQTFSFQVSVHLTHHQPVFPSSPHFHSNPQICPTRIPPNHRSVVTKPCTFPTTRNGSLPTNSSISPRCFRQRTRSQAVFHPPNFSFVQHIQRSGALNEVKTNASQAVWCPTSTPVLVCGCELSLR